VLHAPASVLPRRITPALVRLLASFRPLRLVVQVNHPRELDPACRQALGLLAAARLPLLAQSVLLAGVNDRARTLAELFAALSGAGVRPYYLFQPDLARGTAHFRPDPARGLRVYREAAALCAALHAGPAGGARCRWSRTCWASGRMASIAAPGWGGGARYPCYTGPMTSEKNPRISPA
jgi:lysine 2,3-aminomutase